MIISVLRKTAENGFSDCQRRLAEFALAAVLSNASPVKRGLLEGVLQQLSCLS